MNRNELPPVGPDAEYEGEKLKNHPAFKGGMLMSDYPALEETVDIETKEITQTATTEEKARDVKSGVAQRGFERTFDAPCTDPKCAYAGSWHQHSGA